MTIRRSWTGLRMRLKPALAQRSSASTRQRVRSQPIQNEQYGRDYFTGSAVLSICHIITPADPKNNTPATSVISMFPYVSGGSLLTDIVRTWAARRLLGNKERVARPPGPASRFTGAF